jgi:hypothetical protein
MGARVSNHIFSFILNVVKSHRLMIQDELIQSADWLEALVKETEETADLTMEPIVLEAKNVAMDILKAMRDAAVTNASEAEELQAIFDAP